MELEKIIVKNPEFITKIIKVLHIKDEQMLNMIKIYNEVSKNPEEYKNISFQKTSHWDWNIKVDLKEKIGEVGVNIYLFQKKLNSNKIIPFGNEEGYMIALGGEDNPYSISLSLHNPITL